MRLKNSGKEECTHTRREDSPATAKIKEKQNAKRENRRTARGQKRKQNTDVSIQPKEKKKIKFFFSTSSIWKKLKRFSGLVHMNDPLFLFEIPLWILAENMRV